MDAPPTLDYARPAPGVPFSNAAILALVVGIPSGPVATVVAMLVSNAQSGSAGDWLGMVTLIVVQLLCLAYCWAAEMHAYRSRGVLRGRWLAVLGFLASLAWPVFMSMCWYVMH
jgi:hypothetical protein